MRWCAVSQYKFIIISNNNKFNIKRIITRLNKNNRNLFINFDMRLISNNNSKYAMVCRFIILKIIEIY